MRVLVACEESQRVCQAFRDHGHDAYSCDILSTSGDHPEWHIQGRAELYFYWRDWDLMIAFPPCTNLAVSGAAWFAEKIKDGRQQAAIDFFMEFVNADIPKIAIENPVGIMSTVYRKPDQIIQPWMFGHPEQKKTCLWLKGLPKLYPTSTSLECENNRTHAKMMKLPRKERERIHYLSPSRERAKIRSKTFLGIA